MIDSSAAPSGAAASAADPLDVFTAHRGVLFGTAYRLLGSVADAEDVLQDAWIKWSAAGRAEQVENPRAYLVRTVTNLSLTRLTSARAVRESYVGPWLPEPVLTEADAAEGAVLADSVSTALLVVLESLGPVERAVFVLREAFGFSHAEIAGFLDRSEATVRQTAHRAREHVRARRPRFDTDPEQRREVTGRFLAACDGGDLNAMLELLAPDVTAWSDGGGKVTAARRPLHGADPVARWMVGVLAKPSVRGTTWRSASINGEEGVLFTVDGHPIGALTFDLADGLIRNLRFQVNPDKLRGLLP